LRRGSCFLISAALLLAGCGGTTPHGAPGPVAPPRPPPPPVTPPPPAPPPPPAEPPPAQPPAPPPPPAQPGGIDEETIAKYRPREPDFWNRYQYYAYVTTDIEAPRDTVFDDGVGICVFTAQGYSLDRVERAISKAHGLSDDGAKSVAAAAFDVFCTDTGYRVVTRTTQEAAAARLRLTQELHGEQVDEEGTERNVKLACWYLDNYNTAGGLSDYMFANGFPFLDHSPNLTEIKALVRVAVGVRCISHTLGPWWDE
jgi:hypothetical protein